MKSTYSLAAVLVALAGCGGLDEPDVAEAKKDPGALVETSMSSTVGVLLDEIPASMRDRVAASLIAKPQSFWVTRARNQIRLTTYRLVFRQYFYHWGTGSRAQLPLPPAAVQNVALVGTPRRATVEGHDYVLVDYKMSGTLVTTATSPDAAEPNLSRVGGTWNEPFILPIDPELLFQRTRFACMDEEDFPPNSVDSEEVDSFYDQDCEVELELGNVGQCHFTELPDKSCVDALTAKVGKISTTADFKRIAWDAGKAAAARVGTITNQNGPDLDLIEAEFESRRVVYRYIPEDSCTIVEGCVGLRPDGRAGWRRLLQFSTSDQNTGTKTLDIGPIDYYLSGRNGYVSDWGLFELSSCHQHYHFKHYGDFHYGPEIERKNGFCLQSTERVLNHEFAPLTNAYGGCDYQGVEAGWADQYKAGLECQWVDVTTVDTSRGAVTYPLSFTTNPEGFLCEGTPVLDRYGNPTWEPVFNADGTPMMTNPSPPAQPVQVHKPRCELYGPWIDNNFHSYDVVMPKPGEGYVTQACDRGQVGPLRNCGFAPPSTNLDCAAGQQVTARCTRRGAGAPQVARLCEYSHVLGAGTACAYQDATANAVVDGTVDVTFTCPAARDPMEPGGRVTLYTAPVYPDDAASPVTCTIL